MDAFCNVNDADSNPINTGRRKFIPLSLIEVVFCMHQFVCINLQLNQKALFPRLLKTKWDMATGQCLNCALKIRPEL